MKLANKYLSHIKMEQTAFTNKLALLKAIHFNHLLKIPFENLDLIIGKSLSMDPETVLKKILNNQRGGVCYEINSLLYAVLKELDFDVYPISGRFWDEEKQTFGEDCSHLALLVKIEHQNYLFDLGIGGGFMYPVLLEKDYVYEDIQCQYRVSQPDPSTPIWFVLQRNTDEGWTDQFGVDTRPRKIEEFHPVCANLPNTDSIFLTKKFCTIYRPAGRVTLTDDSISIVNYGHKKKHEITSHSEWDGLLLEYFQIRWNSQGGS